LKPASIEKFQKPSKSGVKNRCKRGEIRLIKTRRIEVIPAKKSYVSFLSFEKV
jgi:hypothetical protein